MDDSRDYFCQHGRLNGQACPHCLGFGSASPSTIGHYAHTISNDINKTSISGDIRDYLDEEPQINIQAWICPICCDDHRVNDENRVYCKPGDLLGVIKERDELKAQLQQMQTMSEPLDTDGFNYEDLYLLAKAEVERLREREDALLNANTLIHDRAYEVQCERDAKINSLEAEIERLKGEMLTLIKAWDDYFLPDQSPDKEHLFNLFTDAVAEARSALLEGGGGGRMSEPKEYEGSNQNIKALAESQSRLLAMAADNSVLIERVVLLERKLMTEVERMKSEFADIQAGSMQAWYERDTFQKKLETAVEALEKIHKQSSYGGPSWYSDIAGKAIKLIQGAGE